MEQTLNRCIPLNETTDNVYTYISQNISKQLQCTIILNPLDHSHGVLIYKQISM